MLKGFDFQKKLGEGAYSSVYRVKRLEDNQIYALKMVKLKELNEVEKQNALNEVRIIASVRSPNVVNYKECFIDKQLDVLCIVMDYASEGDLLQKIQEHQKKGSYMKEEDIWNIFIQMLKGLKSMHDMNIMHRDLKSANVFLYEDRIAKLGDFNVSKLQKKNLLYTQTGTPYYASPEVWKDMPYDKKADIWSLGCVLYEMAALRPPFKAEDMQQLYKKITSGKFARIPDFYSNDLMYIINQLIQVQPYYRPSCNQILKNNIVKKYILDRHLFEVEEKSILLNTIKFPKDFKNLDLPKSNYTPIKLKKVSQHVKTLENDNSLESAEELKSQRLLTETENNNDDTQKKKNLPQVSENIQSNRQKKENPLNEYRVENIYHKGVRHRNSSIKKSAQQLSNESSPLPVIQNQRKLSLSISKNNQCSLISSQKDSEVHRQILKSNTNGTSNISQMSYNVQEDKQNYLALKQFIIKQKMRGNRNLSPLHSNSQTPDKKEKLNNNSINYSNNNIIKNINQNSNLRILPSNINKDSEPQKPTLKINYRQQTLSPNMSANKPTTERPNMNIQNPPEIVSPYKLLPKIYSSSINQQMNSNQNGIDIYIRGSYQNKIKKRVYSNQATLNYDGSQDLSQEEPSYYKLNQTKDVSELPYQDQDITLRTPSQNKKKIKYQSVDINSNNNNSFLKKIKDQSIFKSKELANNLSIISADDLSQKSKRRNSNKLQKSIEKRQSRQNNFKDKDQNTQNINNNSNILVKVDDQQQ